MPLRQVMPLQVCHRAAALQKQRLQLCPFQKQGRSIVKEQQFFQKILKMLVLVKLAVMLV